ncbi:AsmA family protein, partial [Bacteroidia bacterium]|nr:AsmA family protein [Bacteroidia bacterium]
MKRFLKIAAVISILLTLVIGGVVFYFYTNIKPILVREINKSLAVEVKVGDITVSGIRDFPNLGVRFSDVSIAESTPYYNKYLLEAQELNLFVDIMKLYKGEYLIDGVTVRNGAIRAVDLNKTTNYEITKPSSDTSSGGVSFEIKTLKLINCDIAYEHTPSKFKSNAYSPSTTLNLKYEENSTSLKVKTTLDSAFIASADDVYVARRNLKINTAIVVVTDKEQVIISQSDIAIEAINLTTKGTIGYGNSSNVDITFANDNTTVQSLLSVLPVSITQSLERIKLEGNVEIDGYFKGKTDGINSPDFGFDYLLQNTSLTIVGENISLDGIEASG